MKEAMDGRLKNSSNVKNSVNEVGKLIKVTISGKVARIELNNGKNNLLNTNVLDELDGVIDKLWNDREVFVIVIAGNENVFSAGAELTQFIPDFMDFMEFVIWFPLLNKGRDSFHKIL